MPDSIYLGGPFIAKGRDHGTSFGGVIHLFETPDAFLAQLEERSKLFLQNDGDQNLFSHKGDHLSHISTDHIIKVEDLLTDDPELLAARALRGLPAEYNINHGTIKNLKGTVLVAGKAFGVGSSREQAVSCLQYADFEAVLAESFGPIFQKNAVYLGLLTSTNLDLAPAIERGEPVPLGEFLKGKSPLQQEIIRAGGLFHYLRYVNAHPSERPRIPERPKRPMNIYEKRLARVLDVETVTPGDSAIVSPDLAYSYVVLSGPARMAMVSAYGQVQRKLDQANIVLFEDHFALSNNPNVPELTANQRRFAEELGVPKENYHFGRTSEGGAPGISHRVMIEAIDPREKQIVIATDSHTPTLGALPIIAMPVGSTLLAAAIGEGAIPISVENVMRVELTGKLPKGLTIRDVQLELAATTKVPTGTAVIEFGGKGLNTLSFGQVVALCNMVPEIFVGAEMAVTEPFTAGIEFLQKKYGISEQKARELYGLPDEGSEYTEAISYDLSKAVPWIALPGKPTNGISLSQLKESPKIQKAYIVSCTNAIDELAVAAAILKDRKVADGIDFIIIPSSRTVQDEAKRLGYLDILKEAGAVVREEIACSACIGDGPDAVLEGQVAISATNRNFHGRMGHKTADVYLAGSILTTLGAMLGHIPTIEEYQQEIGRITQNLNQMM